MLKIFVVLLLSIFSLLLDSKRAHAQTVYFHNYGSPSSAISFIPVIGPASALQTLASGLSGSANNSAVGIDFNGSDTFYFSDPDSDQIFSVTKSGTVTIIANSTSGIDTPVWLSLDRNRNLLYISDSAIGRIVRADLTQTLPVGSIDEVISSVSGVASEMSDMKYNAVDDYLYWTDMGNLYRADTTATIPISVFDTLTRVNSGSFTCFDFDSETPQSVYLCDSGFSSKGLYKSAVPVSPSVALNEVIVFDASALTSFFFSGIAIDRAGPTMCFSASDSPSNSLRCGDNDITPVTEFSEILASEVLTAPGQLVIESAPTPTPTPTATPTATPPPIVRPDTKPEAPQVTINSVGGQMEVVILLQEFSGAEIKKNKKNKAILQAKKARGGVTFQYMVEVKRVADSQGNPLKRSERDNRDYKTKRNELTLKNLRANSTYDVRYRVEIASKPRGQPEKIVKKTSFSPNTRFTLP